MKTPSVSIIIPIYNTAPYLRACLDSVVGQTLKDIEIILVNDASTDQSQQIIDEYASQDSRILTINNTENQGQGIARNKGIKIATGKYIGFVDSDDYIDREMFFSMYQKAENSQADTVVCGLKKMKGCHLIRVHTFKKEKIITGKEIILKFAKDELPEGATVKIQKRELVTQHNIRFSESVFMEDGLHAFYSFYHAKKVALLPCTFYYYNSHEQSTLSSVGYKHIKGTKETFIEMKKVLQSMLSKREYEEIKHNFFYKFWTKAYHFHTFMVFRTHRFSSCTMKNLLVKTLYRSIKTTDPFKNTTPDRWTEKLFKLAISRPVIFITTYNFIALAWKIKTQLFGKRGEGIFYRKQPIKKVYEA